MERYLPHQAKSKNVAKSFISNDLGRRIRQVRSELGLNQTEFAAVVGVSISTMSHWESGTFVPRKSLLERIAQVVPERYKAYFLEIERPVHQKSALKNVSNVSTAELALLEQQKTIFLRRLRNQLGPRLKKWNSVHVQVMNISEQRFVSFSVNHPDNKGVIVYLDPDHVRAHRTDVHSSQFRDLHVDWASLLLPFGQRWAKLKLIFRRSDQVPLQ